MKSSHSFKAVGEPQGLAIRLQAITTLDAVLEGARFAPLGASTIPDPRDRALANRLVTTALRRHQQISLVIAELLDRGIPKRAGAFEPILRLSLAQLLFLPELGAHSAIFLAVEATKRDRRAGHLAKLMNAVLRRADAERERLLTLPPSTLLPKGLAQGWQSQFGEAALEAFAQALLDGAPLDLTLRDDDPALVETLNAKPIWADSVRVHERDTSVDGLPGYDAGRWWVQDAASALPARLLGLPPGARVLDLCAAPGGKTAQLIKAGHEVTALDADPERMARLQSNLDRLGYSARTIVADATAMELDESFDAVLLDAPCSATGTFRRHPEVLLNVTPKDIAGRVALQRQLATQAIKAVAPGGVLVYCVCSLQAQEGEAQAAWLAVQDDLVASPIRPEEVAGFESLLSPEGWLRAHPGLTVPGAAGGTLDGFFVARFQRR